jgi:glycosyltransferase involved in cell wall biosynthesis
MNFAMGGIAVHAPRVTYYKGGAERYILNLLVELSRNRSDISLVSYDSPKKSEWFLEFSKKFKGKIYLVRSSKMDGHFGEFVNASKPALWDKESKMFGNETKQFYEKGRFRTVVCHYAVDCLSLPKGQEVFLHLHGLPDKKREIENKAVKVPRKIIAVSNYVGNGWKRLHGIKKKIFVVPNGIFLGGRRSEKKDIDIIYFGRLIKIKGVDVLLKSIGILNKENIFPRVEIIGDGPEKERLIKLAKRLGLRNVNFLGKVTDRVLFFSISSSKISVFPSYRREGIMTTLLEASKYGSVIVASNSCSNKEFVFDGFNGVLFKPKNSKDLAMKLKRVLSDKELREKLARNSFDTLKEFVWQKQAKKIGEIYG